MNSVIFYYMEGCPWCVKFYDEWSKFEKLAIINGFEAIKIERKSLNSTNLVGGNIQGFPTIRIKNSNGEVFDYNGARTATELLEFSKNHFIVKQNGGGLINNDHKINKYQSKYKNALKQLYSYKINKYSQKLDKLNI